MGMFAKVIAFLDKAAGVPAWVTHAENLRTLEDRGCVTLAKAMVENKILWPLSSYSLEEMIPQIAGIITLSTSATAPEIEELKQLVHEVIAAAEGPVEGPLQVLYDFVEVDAPSASSEYEDLDDEEDREDALAALQTDRELSELSMDMVVASAPSVTDLENLAETVSLTGGLSEEECLATVPGAALDPQVRMQLVQGMMKVISRGRKPGPTLKVLKTMAAGDQAAITEALEEMAKQGNRLASAILEDPSL